MASTVSNGFANLGIIVMSYFPYNFLSTWLLQHLWQYSNTSCSMCLASPSINHPARGM